jgi:hypothetical protein
MGRPATAPGAALPYPGYGASRRGTGRLEPDQPAIAPGRAIHAASTSAQNTPALIRGGR